MLTHNKEIAVTANRTQEIILQGWDIDSPPLVCICCITYNHASYIKEAIDSFLMQETDFSFEVLVHDDASTDGTTDIILAYAEKYPSIIKPIIQTENQFSKGGLINARLVFPKAKGKYIALCDGDDYWADKTKLQKQVLFLENNSEYVITYTDCQPFDETGSLNIDFGAVRRDLESKELQKSTPINTLTTCFRNVIDQIPQDLMSARHGDLVIWSLLGHYGKGKYMTDIVPSAYRVHADGIHSKKSKKEKMVMVLITYSALLAYYRRISDDELSDYFMDRVIEYSVRSVGVTGVFRVFISRIIGKANERFF